MTDITVRIVLWIETLGEKYYGILFKCILMEKCMSVGSCVKVKVKVEVVGKFNRP
jgi:hypothetical protein